MAVAKNRSVKMKKILLIRFNSIGDIVLTSPVVRFLSREGYELHYVLKKTYKELVVHNPGIHKCWFLEDDLDSLIQELKEEEFDLVVDLHNTIRSKYLRRALKRPSRVLKKHRVKDWLMVNFGLFRQQKKHMSLRFMELVQDMINTKDPINTEFHFPDERQENSYLDVNESYVCIAVATAFYTKTIPVDILHDLIQKIDRKIVLLGGPADQQIAESLVEMNAEKPVLNLVGKIDIIDSASILEDAAVLITGDTGLMHIAAALGTPTVSIFASTHPILGFTPFYGSREVEHYIIQNDELSCRPCTKQGRNSCPKSHFKCMNGLSVDEIYSKVERLI